MAQILKYRIKGEYPEEEEFEVTKTVITTTTHIVKQKVDNNGNIISGRHPAIPDIRTDVKEGISAVSLPSKTSVKVEILETTDGLTEIAIQEQMQATGRQDIRPIADRI